MKETLGISEINLRVRVFEDEYKGCKNELSLPDGKLNLVDKCKLKVSLINNKELLNRS